GCVALVEIALIVGGVDEDLARGDGGGHPMTGEAAPDAEDHVGLAEILQGVAGHHGSARAQGERMVLREGALALEGGHDGSLEQLGQLEGSSDASAYRTPCPAGITARFASRTPPA